MSSAQPITPPPPFRPDLLAIAPNLDFDWVFKLHQIFGRMVVSVELEQRAEIFRLADLDEFLRKQLLPAEDGDWEATHWGKSAVLILFHVRSPRILEALQMLRNRLASLQWLPFCQIAIADPDSLTWRRFFP